MILPLEIAFREYGNEAWPGVATNPAVEKYFDETGNKWVDDDETPWCAAFLNWVLKQAGLPTLNKLNARSFLDFGTPTDTPELVDVVVLWRLDPTGPYGHVGFYIRETQKMIYILGGNQSGRVCILPFNKTQLLGYRKY